MRIFMKIAGMLLFSCLMLNGVAQDQPVRVDPPFWWVGMENPVVQLMFHAEGIGNSEVLVNYPGVKLLRKIRLENPNYYVLDLEVSKDAQPGKVQIVFEYQREVLYAVEYEIFDRVPGSKQRKGFGKEDVIYLIMPDRFSNGDMSNDSVPGILEAAHPENPNGRHGGDIKGISDMTGYLADLGVTALWLNPVQENNMKAYSYHGYAITDFYRVDPRLGTNESYRNFVGTCHQNNLKVIMDMVFNHCGGNHFWIKDLPADNWIHQFPEFTRSNFRAETAMDPYASDYDRERMLTGWFDTPMPDLNQHNEILAEYLIQNSIWWVEFAGLDGIRMDTYPYSYKDFMAEWMGRLLAEYPDFTLVGETWLQKEAHTAFWQNQAPVSGSYDSHLPSTTDFPMQYALKDAFVENEGWTTGLNRFYYVLSQDFVYEDPFMNVIFADNHDLTRFYTSLGENYNKYRMAMAVLLTIRGIPMLYYGTEYLMTGEESKGHGFIRENFPGGKWESSVVGRQSSVDSRQSSVGSEQLEAFEYLKKLLNWRKDSEAIHSGRLKQFVPQDGIYVYARYTDSETVMVIINKNKEAKTLDLKRFKEVLKDYRVGTDVISKEKYPLENSINLKPETAIILELTTND